MEKIIDVNLDIDIKDNDATKKLYKTLNDSDFFGDIVTMSMIEKNYIERIKKDLLNSNNEPRYNIWNRTSLGNMGLIVARCPNIEIKQLALDNLKNYQKYIRHRLMTSECQIL